MEELDLLVRTFEEALRKDNKPISIPELIALIRPSQVGDEILERNIREILEAAVEHGFVLKNKSGKYFYREPTVDEIGLSEDEVPQTSSHKKAPKPPTPPKPKKQPKFPKPDIKKEFSFLAINKLGWIVDTLQEIKENEMKAKKEEKLRPCPKPRKPRV